jgi:hypothetical protein
MSAQKMAASSKTPLSFIGITMSSPFDYAAAREYVGTVQFASFMVSMVSQKNRMHK